MRSLGALSGGLLREIGEVVVPASLRRTTLYRTMVEVTLRFLIEEVGQVEGVYPTSPRQVCRLTASQSAFPTFAKIVPHSVIDRIRGTRSDRRPRRNTPATTQGWDGVAPGVRF